MNDSSTTVAERALAPETARAMHGSGVLVGYLCAVSAGTLWGTTGPLSTALYAEGAQLTGIGFWRVLLAVAAFVVWGLTRKDFFRFERRALLLAGLIGGFFVALFEVAFQYAIAGVGVASAVVLLYTAPVIVAILGRIILREALTPARLLLAFLVMIGVALTVNGAVVPESAGNAASASNRAIGIAGGLLSAVSFAGMTIVARYTVPRWGTVKVLFLELVGGSLILAIVLPLAGHAPVPPATASGWLFILALCAGSVLLANFAYFAAVRRIDAAPTSVAASIEPVVG
ncbi:MAG: DMT family transporter, partial [Longimicrobiales bacterium]